jgi:Putative zinc-finger
MEQLPKIVREQLRMNSAVEPHPDADLLTAYMEQSLTSRERLQIDDHLAGCSECRQIVALAIPETGSVVVAGETARVSGKSWLRWPALRWGAIAACVVVVSGAVVMQFTRKASAPARYSAEQAPRHVEPAPSTQTPAPQYEAKAIPPASTMVRVEPSAPRESKKAKSGVSAGPGGAVGGVFRAPAQASKEQQSANARAMLSRTDNLGAVGAEKKAAPPESAANAVTDNSDMKTSGANVAAAPAPNGAAVGGRLSNQATVGAASETAEVTSPSASVETETVDVAKARRQPSKAAKQEASNQAMVNFSPKPLPEVAANTKGMADFKAPRWTLSENGLPQRSFNSGKTWEEVQVDHKSGFRALASVGLEVWVGGKNGLLYHTSDMGLHWKPVTPSSSGTSLSNDIVRIEFSDPQHGRLIAGDGQSWVTLDGGKTWERK